MAKVSLGGLSETPSKYAKGPDMHIITLVPRRILVDFRTPTPFHQAVEISPFCRSHQCRVRRQLCGSAVLSGVLVEKEKKEIDTEVTVLIHYPGSSRRGVGHVVPFHTGELARSEVEREFGVSRRS